METIVSYSFAIGILGRFRKSHEPDATAAEDSNNTAPKGRPSGIALFTLRVVLAKVPLESMAVTL